MGGDWFDLTPGALPVALFAIGWLAGWLVFWRARPIPAAGGGPRDPMSIVIPARDEAGSIAQLVTGLVPELGVGDELVVVDDRSGDRTAALATAAGAHVVGAPEPPVGWLGKPHACSVGVRHTTAPILVFLDADIRPEAGLLERLGSVLRAHPSALVSVQPWHATLRRYEWWSLVFNVVGPMGSGAFTVFGAPGHRGRPLAFGPVLACRRSEYERVGGHAAPTVRRTAAEDLALGRLFDRVQLYTGFPAVSFRMYPDGLRSLIQGWTKIMATGAAHSRRWVALLTALWLWSLIGGWTASPWFYLASTVQLAVFARRVGRFGWAPVVGPVLGAFFVVVFVRSLVLRVLGRDVRWKGRIVSPR